MPDQPETQGRECLVLGMPLDTDPESPLRTCQPIAAVVIVKALDEAGNMCYFTGATDGLLDIEALGMTRLAQLRLERGIDAGLTGDT